MAPVAWAGVNLEIFVLPISSREGDQPADHVQPVEAGRQVEDGAVRRGRQRGLVLGDQGVVLVRLAEHEDHAHARSVSMYQRRSAKTSPRSAANTPNWQVNDDAPG